MHYGQVQKKHEKEMDSVVRRAKSCRKVRHQSTGLNLLMTGADLLDGCRDTPRDNGN
jgi:hypothetical protein